MAVLWIRDFLVWIRIRGSIPLTYGFGSSFFCQWLTRYQEKKAFFQMFFCLQRYLYFLKLHLHPSSKIKSQKEVKKIVEIKVFPPFFACWCKDPDLTLVYFLKTLYIIVISRMKCEFAAQLSRGRDQLCRIRNRIRSRSWNFLKSWIWNKSFRIHNPVYRSFFTFR